MDPREASGGGFNPTKLGATICLWKSEPSITSYSFSWLSILYILFVLWKNVPVYLSVSWWIYIFSPSSVQCYLHIHEYIYILLYYVYISKRYIPQLHFDAHRFAHKRACVWFLQAGIPQVPWAKSFVAVWTAMTWEPPFSRGRGETAKKQEQKSGKGVRFFKEETLGKHLFVLGVWGVGALQLCKSKASWLPVIVLGVLNKGSMKSPARQFLANGTCWKPSRMVFGEEKAIQKTPQKQGNNGQHIQGCWKHSTSLSNNFPVWWDLWVQHPFLPLNL